MGGSAADTPATPDFLRASDAERDHAVDELRQEFVEGRLSHETFMVRMQSALGARNHAQLAGLFSDLPPRQGHPFNPSQLIARLRAAFRLRDYDAAGAATDWNQGAPVDGSQAPGASGGAGAGAPAPLFFPPGSGTSFTIGRTHDCDLRIENMSVSRLHAQLIRDGDGWLLSDLGSHNGTRVNGWLVREPVPVRAGDLIQFGSAMFIVQTPPRAPADPPRVRAPGGPPGG
jgi:pSer/pThr/pTyr-binding forkhead associated (FHA) protein